MTNHDERQSVASIYDASRRDLKRAEKTYLRVVKKIVRPEVAEPYFTSRVKDRRSLIRKLAKDQGGSLRGWAEITDKVGVRVVCSTKRERKAVARALERHQWASCVREDKEAGTQKLEYTGIHVTVHDGDQVDSLGEPILCEIQVRTRAQDAWSVVSHKLTYKGLVKLPRRAKRVVWRLSVLPEIFDDEIHRMFKKRESMAEFRMAKALEYLDERYGEVLGEPGAGPGDLDIMSVLWKAYSAEEQASFQDLIEKYLSDNVQIPGEIRAHQPGVEGYMESRDWLSTQPEVIAILERGTNSEYMLAEAVAGTDLSDSIEKVCNSYGIYLPA